MARVDLHFSRSTAGRARQYRGHRRAVAAAEGRETPRGPSAVPGLRRPPAAVVVVTLGGVRPVGFVLHIGVVAAEGGVAPRYEGAAGMARGVGGLRPDVAAAAGSVSATS